MTLPNGNTVEIATIPFHGTDVLAALIDGKEHIVLRPAIEPFGLDYSSQLRKLKAKSWACVVNLTMQLPGDTQAREHAAVDVRTFLMLLATINEKQVAKDVRELLVKFQNEIADAIEAYFTKGVAVNPRTATTAPVPAGDDLFLMEQMIRTIRADRERVAAIEMAQRQQAAQTQEIAARMDGIEGKHDWFAALAYAKISGLPTDRIYLQKLGTAAARITRRMGFEPSKTQHAQYGFVNVYPIAALDSAVDALSVAA